MKTQIFTYIKYAGMLLCSTLLFFSCSKEEGPGQEPDPTEKSELVLTASATEIDTGDEVTFEVTSEDKAIDADIYIDNEKISGTSHTFDKAGTHQVVAKKEGYTDSEAIAIKSYQVDVYVAGSKIGSTGSGSVPTYWKNGTAVVLPSGTIGGEAFDITVQGEDVYVSGYTSHGSHRATYWKNGTAVHLSDGTWMAEANAIVVNGDDVYVAGFESTGAAYRATYWKNGTTAHLSDGSVGTTATGIVVDGGDVHVSGYENTSIARYWKNGTAVFSGAPGTMVYDIAVDGDDVYLAGNRRYGSTVPMYWKNETPVPLSDGTPSAADNSARAIVLNGDDIYMAGFSLGDGGATYWKNKTAVPLTDENGEIPPPHNIYAYDIAVDGENIYVAGKYYNGSELVAAYWKNGTLVTLESVYSEANSICIVRSLGNN